MLAAPSANDPDKTGGSGPDRPPRAREGQFDRSLLEACPDCVKLISLGGAVLLVNAAGRQLMEIEDFSAFAGQPWTSFWPAGTRPQVERALAAARSGNMSRFSGFRPTARGKPKWWDVVVCPVQNADGEITHLLSVSRDITAQKSTEQSLRTSERRFRALTNNIAQLAWMADATGYVFWYNQRWFEYTGTALEEMAGWGWTAVHHPAHVDRVVKKVTACFESGEAWEDTFPLRSASGEYRWFLSRAMPYKDETGRIELWCGTSTDITEQRNLSQRLRQLARIVELSHEAILIWDFGDGIVSWNKGCEELYGYTKNEAIGAEVRELLRTQYPLGREEFFKLITAAGEWSGELLQYNKAGKQVWAESRQELIPVCGRNLVFETNRDVTERRKADEIRNLLMGELNHRVKNTLAIVQSIAMQTARWSKDKEEFVCSFNGRLQSLSAAHDLLTEAHWAGCRIRDLITAGLDVTAADVKKVELKGEDVFLPPKTALQLTLIFHELTGNALKHGALSRPEGRVTIAWTTEPAEPPVVHLTWQERGGPPVLQPETRGFGRTLIERSGQLPHLNAELLFEPDGVTCRIAAVLTPSPGECKEGGCFNPGGDPRG